MTDGWRLATIAAIREETASARTLVLKLADWPGHFAGQYAKVRLLPGEEDRTERTFSIASPPEQQTVELTIERLPAGQVSSVLCGHDMEKGYQFEISGPRGSFVWRAEDGGPLLLVAGGSGIAPLMAMLRHRAIARDNAEWRQHIAGAHLLYSSQSWDRVIYREELAQMVQMDATLQVTHTLTRQPPPAWQGLDRRIDRDMLREVAWSPAEFPRIYICGPAAMVEESATALVGLGHDPTMIFTERFGPTGGKSLAA